MKLSLIVLLASSALPVAHADLGPVTLADLAGSWNSDCLPTDNQSSALSVLEFTERGEVTDTSVVFDDAQCSTPFSTAISKQDFSINSDSLSATATAFDSTLEFHTLIGVAGANQKAACGIFNWLIDTERSVFDTPCSPMSTINMKIGKVDSNTLRVTICAEGEACSTADYTRAR